MSKELAIGTKVEINWSLSPNLDNEIGEIVSLSTPNDWQEVKFEDGITMKLPRYMMIVKKVA